VSTKVQFFPVIPDLIGNPSFFFKKILAVQKKFLPLQSRLKKTGFFNEIIENTERLKVQASTEKL
jgi:hypothetical protein